MGEKFESLTWIYEAKRRLRKRMKAKRAALPKDERQARSARVVEQIEAMERFQRASVIHSFIPDEARNEVNLAPLLKKIVASKKLLAPVVQGGDLISVEIASLDDLEPNALGVLEPKSRTPSPLEAEIDLALVPLLAADRSGNRLGYGKGYYDRFFKRLNKPIFKLGVAFDLQIVRRVPTTADDVKLDAIATESGIIETHASPNARAQSCNGI